MDGWRMNTASDVIRGTVDIAGSLGPWPAMLVSKRLTPIFTREFVEWLKVTPNEEIATVCGVSSICAWRWKKAAGVQGFTAKGKILMGEAAKRGATASAKSRKSLKHRYPKNRKKQ